MQRYLESLTSLTKSLNDLAEVRDRAVFPVMHQLAEMVKVEATKFQEILEKLKLSDEEWEKIRALRQG